MGRARQRRHRSPPARARHQSPPGNQCGEGGATDRGRPRDPAGHRVGNRRGRRALDPPGQADDGAAARRVVGLARARRIHPDAAVRRMDRRAGHSPFRVVAADGHGGPHARPLSGVDGADRSAAIPRGGQRLVLLLHQLPLRRRIPPQPAGNAGTARSLTTSPRWGDSTDRAPQLPGVRAEVARGPAAALPSGRGRCRAPRETLPVADLPELGQVVDQCGGSATRWRTAG